MTVLNDTLTLDRVNSLLDYNPASGEFRWRVPRKGVRLGQPAGTDHSSGCRYICIEGSRHKAHRLAWLITHGVWPAGEIDHINGNPGDNRIANLRLATHTENQRNRAISKNNSSGYSGVLFDRGRWRARIKVSRVTIYLGSFKTLEEAIQARLKAEIIHFKDFRRQP